MEEVEEKLNLPTLRAISSIQNGKLGGRPKGRKNSSTIKRGAVLEAYRQRVYQLTGKLLNSQLVLANGQQFLYRMDPIYETKTNKKGETYKTKTGMKKPVLVENPEEIESFLSELQGANGAIDESYYFLTTKEPDASAIENILNRAYGRPGDMDKGDGEPTAIFKQFETMIEEGKMSIKGKALELYLNGKGTNTEGNL